MAEWQRARLIPVSGISSEREAEMRATSALLAAIEAVRDLSVEMFSPLGASRAQKATVRCYIEVPFKLGSGKSAIRPDGLVQIRYGKSTFTALVEVKTGVAELSADQVNGYWDIARDERFDAVVTISNEIAPSRDVHPTDGLKVRTNSKVKVHHYSWTAILTMCEVLKDHHGVEDPEQAWILGELIRYLRHPNSGANPFDDMGPDWVSVRDAARDDSIRRSDPAVRDIAHRWDQLLRYAALRLEADIGQTVAQQLPSAQRDPAKRLQHLVDLLHTHAQLEGTLRIPNTAGDLELAVDLRARRISAAVTASAPEDRGGRARCTWLASQLGDDVDDRTVIEAYPKNARTPITATLAEVREDKDCLLGEDRREPSKFRIILARDMGMARKTGRKAPGFIDSMLGLITGFYGTVVQNLTPWTPSAPKITRVERSRGPEAAARQSDLRRAPRDAEDPDEDISGPELARPPSRGGGSDGHDGVEVQHDPWVRVTRGRVGT